MNQMQLFDQMPESDLAILKKAMGILNRYFDGASTPVKKTRNRGIHRTTQLCLDEIKSAYGKEWILRHDVLFKEIYIKHKKWDVSNLIKKYVELNLIEVVRDTKNKNNNIIKFRFL